MVARFLNYVRTDLWRVRLDEMSRSKFFLIRWLRIVVLSVRGFDEDNCMLRASSLTFFTLLSIVPIFAMMFAIAKGFGMEKRVEAELLKNFQGQEEVVGRMIGFARNMLDNTRKQVQLLEKSKSVSTSPVLPDALGPVGAFPPRESIPTMQLATRESTKHQPRFNLNPKGPCNIGR